jgi:gluconate kinase
MIVFLFGTWGSGKSHVGSLIQERCGLPHIEADMHFDKKMLAAIHQRKFHELDMGPYYDRVIGDIFAFQRRSQDFVVSQAIYQEYYRDVIFNSFSPEIRFVWVKMKDEYLQKARLDARAAIGNPITSEVYEYMKSFWEDPIIPHDIVFNGEYLEEQVRALMDSMGLCVQWMNGEDI